MANALQDGSFDSRDGQDTNDQGVVRGGFNGAHRNHEGDIAIPERVAGDDGAGETVVGLVSDALEGVMVDAGVGRYTDEGGVLQRRRGRREGVHAQLAEGDRLG